MLTRETLAELREERAHLGRMAAFSVRTLDKGNDGQQTDEHQVAAGRLARAHWSFNMQVLRHWDSLLAAAERGLGAGDGR